MNYRDIARVQLRVDEGVRSKPYLDTEGKVTIGIGRNLDDVGLRPDEIDYLFNNDLARAELDARAAVRNFDELSEARKAVLLNMSFNLGRGRLEGFRRMLAAVRVGDFEAAAREMMDSKWAKQVGARAYRLAEMMREG